MPKFDNKRANGPENSVPYQNYSTEHLKSIDEKAKDVLDDDYNRKIEKRDNNESRSIFTKIGLILPANGSCYIERGETKILVAVYGPREIHRQNKLTALGDIFCDFKFAPFSSTKRKPLQTTKEEQLMAMNVQQSLLSAVCRQMIENTQLDVFIQVLQDDGSVLSTSLIAAGLALANASVPMFDIITAGTVGVFKNKTFLDPTAAEEELCEDGGHNHGILTMAKLPTFNQVAGMWQTGHLFYEMLDEANSLIESDSIEIGKVVKQVLVRKIKDSKIEIGLDSE